MILGVGIDIVEIERFRKILSKKSAQSFLKKIAHPSEMKQANQSKFKPQYWASRFAAKEAASKALGTGFGKSFSPSEFAVLNEKNGKPIVSLHGKLEKHLKKLKVDYIHISLSHESNSAIAIVIFEKK